MAGLKYLDRMRESRVDISREKLRNYRVSLSSMTNYEKCEYRIFLARSKKLTYVERVKFKVAFPTLLIMANLPPVRSVSNE